MRTGLFATCLSLTLACGAEHRAERPAPVPAAPEAVAPVVSPPLTAPARERIAVLEFTVGKGIDLDRIYFSDKVRGAIGTRAPKLFVMTRESTDLLLQAAGRTAADCEGECEVETGRKLGADYVVSGRITKVGSRLALTMRLHSTRDAQLLRAAEALAANTDALVDASLGVVDELLIGLGIAPPRRAAPAPPPAPVPAEPQPRTPATTGMLKIVSLPSGAKISIDSQPVGVTPLVKKVDPGTYWITLEKAGFEEASRTVEVDAGKTAVVSEMLKPATNATGSVECKPPAMRRWIELSDPSKPPEDLLWFWVPQGSSLSIDVTLDQIGNETALDLYTFNGRIYDLNSLQSTRGSYRVNGGVCFAVSAYHKNGRNNPDILWLRTDGSWLGGPPHGTGAWTFQFSGPATSGVIHAIVQ
jgi:TolB-like protein